MKPFDKLKVGCLVIVEDTTAGRRWGFPSDETLRGEINYLADNMERLERDLRDVEFSDLILIKSERDVLTNSEKLKDVDAIVVFIFMGGAPAYAEVQKFYKGYGHSLEALWGLGKPTIIFTRAEDEKIYDGNLRALAFVEEHENSIDKSLWIVVNDWNRLYKILKVLQALKKIRNVTAITVGPPSSTLGSYEAMRAAIEKLGIKVIMLTFEDVLKLYDSVKKEAAENIAKQLLEEAAGLLEISKKRAMEEAINPARLYLTCKNLMKEKKAEVITFNCYEGGLKTLGVAPCFALSKLSDEGLLGVCESDFAAMSAMLLSRYITDQPSFLADVVIIPEGNRLLLAHCSCPTKLRGLDEKNLEYYVTTQYETGRSVTVKVLMDKEQVVTIIAPAFNLDEVFLIKGKIIESPNYPICRNQCIIKVSGNVEDFLRKYPGFHWVMIYGDHIEEMEIACKIIGVKPVKIS